LRAFQTVRQCSEQIQTSTRQSNGLQICKSTNGVVSRLLKVLRRPLKIAPSLKMHRELCCDFLRTIAINVLAPLSNSSVQVDTLRW
jgi:hypothetical protein